MPAIDKFIQYFKKNPVTYVLLLFIAIILYLGNFADAIEKIRTFYKNYLSSLFVTAENSLPDLRNTKKITFLSLNQFKTSHKSLALSQIAPGHFDLVASPPTEQVSYCADTLYVFTGDYFASVNMEALAGAGQLEFGGGRSGKGIWFGVNRIHRAYFLHETDDSWTGYNPLNINLNQGMNTLMIQQKNNNIKTYLNGQYVRSYTRGRPTEPYALSVCFKTFSENGGRIRFKDLVIHKFEE